MNNFDPAALECLAAIVEEDGFERAAVRLCITQSAVSQRLTNAGQLLLKHTKMLRLIRANLARDLMELAPNATAVHARSHAYRLPSMPTVLPVERCLLLMAWHDKACRLKSLPTTWPTRTNALVKARCWVA